MYLFISILKHVETVEFSAYRLIVLIVCLKSLGRSFTLGEKSYVILVGNRVF